MAFSISYVFKAIDGFSGVAKDIQKSVNNINKSAAKLNRSFTHVGNRLKTVGKGIGDFGNNLSLKLTAPIGLLGIGAIKAASDIENLETAFVGILGGADKAANMVATLNDFTAKTPFQLSQVARAGKSLLGFGIEAKDIPNVLQQIGDVAAASGAQLTDVSQIFGKVFAGGKLDSMEFMQMLDRGIPIAKELGDVMGVSAEQVNRWRAEGKLGKKVGRDVFVKAFRNLSKEGGFANKAMILQSKTLTGVISTLKDNVILTAASIGKMLLPRIKEMATKAIDIAQKTKAWIKENKELTFRIIKIAGVLSLLGPALIGIGLFVKVAGTAFLGLSAILKATRYVMYTNIVTSQILESTLAGLKILMSPLGKGFSMLIGWISKFTVVQKALTFVTKIGTAVQAAFNFVMAASPIGLAVVAIGALITAGVLLYKNWEKVVSIFESVWGWMKKIASITSSGIGKIFDFISPSLEAPGKLQTIAGGANQPMGPIATKNVNEMKGSMDINIKDRGQNVENITALGIGGLNLGVNRAY